MFVLGVDPGLSRCGYAVLSPAGSGNVKAHAMGVIRTSPQDSVADRLVELRRELENLIDQYRPAVVAVERIFFQNNTRTAIGVAQASGLALVAAAERDIAISEYSPSQVKSVVAGDGAATKAQIQKMVQVLLGLGSLPRPADAADAAALALCHLAIDPWLQGVAVGLDAAGLDRVKK